MHSSTYSGSNRILLPDNGPLPHAVIDNADWAAVDNILEQLLQRLIDYGIATGYLRGRTVQRTSG